MFTNFNEKNERFLTNEFIKGTGWRVDLIIGLTFPRQDLALGLEPSVLTVLPDGDNVRYCVDNDDLPDDSEVSMYLCSVYVTGMHEFFEFCKTRDKSKIYVGGYEPTMNPSRFIDYCEKVIVGPCDEFYETISQSGKVVKGITKFSRLPRYDLWDINLNQQIIPDKNPSDLVTSINTSQGCPMRCDFCCSPLMSDRIISKPLPLVSWECRELKKRSPKYIFIRDENFPLQSDWKEKLIEIESIGAKIYLFASANLCTPSNIEFMASHGVYMICLGLEDITENYTKNKTLDNAVKILHDYGVYVYLSFIVNPTKINTDEKSEEFYLRLMSRFNDLRPEMVCGNFLMPFKGTKLWDQYKDLVCEDDFDLYNSKSAFLEKDLSRRAKDEYDMYKIQLDYYTSSIYPREFKVHDTLHERFIELSEKFREYEEAYNN